MCASTRSPAPAIITIIFMAKKATIKIGSDTKEAEKGLNKVASMINKIGHNDTVKGIKNIGLAFNGVSSAMSVAVKAAQAAKQAIDECTEAYKTQVTAERQLEIAAKNNPYLTKTSVQSLKNFAAELQKISTVGDEQLLPMMTELAAAGRTQAEIQDVMTAALDISASGVMSLESAVDALNKTYAGTTGTLGKTIPEIKELSKEELANGKAVEIVAARYKGMAEEVAKATGSLDQMKNAQGDFLEALGKFTKPAADAWNKMWQSIYENGIKTIAALEKGFTKFGMRMGLQSWVEEANAVYSPDGERGIRQSGTSYMETQDLEILKEILTAKQNSKKFTQDEADALMLVNTELRKRQAIEAQEQKEAEAASAKADRQAAAAKQNEKSANERAAEAYAQYDKTIEKKKQEIEWRRQAGEEISAEAEAQEMATTKLSAWLSMIEKADGAISGTKGRAVEIMADIQQNFSEVAASDDLKAALAEYEKDYNDFAKDIDQIFKKTLKPSEVITRQIETMEAQYQQLTENAVMWEQKSVEERQRLEEEYTAAHADLCRQREEALRAESETSIEIATNTEAQRVNLLQQNMDKVNTLTSSFTNAVNQWANIAMEFVTLEKEEQLDALEDQYKQGLISLEEYEEKKKQIEKEAAEQEYKVRLWEWSAQCVQATADLASAVIKAYKDGGLINALLVGAAASAQLAAVIANKPVPPSGFASGGVVGGFMGASRGSDNTSAAVGLREGEMVLNADQQRNLFESINSGKLGGGFQGDVKVYNYAADSTNTDTQITQDEIRLIITKQVKKDMAAGVYNNEMKQADTIVNGTRYTN